MAVTPVWASISVQAIASGATNDTVNQPSGVANKGLYVAFCSSNSAPTTWTPPASEGWLGPFGSGVSSEQIYYRLTTGSEASTYLWTRSNTTGNGEVAIAYFTPGTFDPNNPLADAVSSSTAVTGNIVMTAATAAVNGSLCVQFVSFNSVGATTWTIPGSATSRSDSSSSGTALRYVLADEVVNAGSTGTRTYSHTSTAAKRGAIVIINPLITSDPGFTPPARRNTRGLILR